MRNRRTDTDRLVYMNGKVVKVRNRDLDAAFKAAMECRKRQLKNGHGGMVDGTRKQAV
jgi:hypothetical protein